MFQNLLGKICQEAVRVLNLLHNGTLNYITL